MRPEEVDDVRSLVGASAAGTGNATFGISAQGGMEAAQLWETLHASRRTIARIAALFFLAVLVFTLSSRMEFKSRGRLYLGEIENKPSVSKEGGDLDLTASDQSSLASEAEILQSDSLITRAILSAGLNVAISPEGWRAPRYFEWLIGKRDPNSVDVGAAEIAAVNTVLGDNYRGVQVFRAVFKSDTQYELWTKSGWLHRILSSAPERRLGIGTIDQPEQFDALSLTLTRGVVRGPRRGAAYEIKVSPIDDVRSDVARRLSVSFPKAITQGEVTKVVSLEFRHPSPHVAAAFLRDLMHDYLEAHQSWKVEDATAAESFVTNQLAVIRQSLDRTEQRLAEYRSNSHVVVLDNEAQVLVEQIGKYEEQRVAARLQVASLSEMKHALKNSNAHLEAYLVGDGDDPVLTNLASTLSKARQDLATLEAKFNPTAPDVREQRAQVDTQLEMIRNYVGNRLTRAQANLETLGGVVSQYEKRLKTVPGAELGLAQLARESEVYSKIYSYLLERQQQTAIIKASRVSKNRVLDEPEEPYRVDSPSWHIRLMIGCLGLFLACALVVLRRVFSSKIQSESELRVDGGRVPIWASVPSFQDLIGESRFEFEEAFRMLRIQLGAIESGAGGQVVLVTSPCPGDGKTTTVFELAAMLAAAGKSVLIVDANLHAPSHHLLVGGAQGPGFSDVLANRCEWPDVLSAGTPPGVCSIRAGTKSASELLSGPQLPAFLDDVRGDFNVILLDAPSFPSSSDALTLCAHCDCVFSVVRIRNTPRALAVDHVNRLMPRSVQYGIVVNEARPASRRPRTSRLKWGRRARDAGDGRIAGAGLSGGTGHAASNAAAARANEGLLSTGKVDLPTH